METARTVKKKKVILALRLHLAVFSDTKFPLVTLHLRVHVSPPKAQLHIPLTEGERLQEDVSRSEKE